jgi:alpha-glucosidase
MMRLFRRLPSPPTPPLSRQGEGRRIVSQAVVEAYERELRQRDKEGRVQPSQTWVSPGAVTTIETSDAGARLRCERGELLLEWLTADCLRVRRVSIQLDNPLLPPLTADYAPPSITLDDTDDTLRLVTAIAACQLDKATGKLNMDWGDAALTDAAISWQPNARARLVLRLPSAAQLAGLGTRNGALELRGRVATVWSSDTLPCAIPFVLLTLPEGACGIFWRDAARLHVDCGAARSDELAFEAESDALDVLLCFGATPQAAVARFTLLNGQFPLPPLWALGYQCRATESLDAGSSAKLGIEFRLRSMPCDAIHLGDSPMRDGRTLTIDSELYPAPRALIDTLHEDGFQVLADVYPAIAQDISEPLYASALRQDAPLRYADGEMVRGATSAGVSVFPDLLRDDVREWWGGEMMALVASGIDGVVCADSAPRIIRAGGAATLPDAALHRMSDKSISHAETHNLYGQMLASASRAPLERQRMGLRPFVAVDSGWAGAQTAGQVWLPALTHDWDGLRGQLRAALNASLSGLPLFGVDVGQGDGELTARWLQMACLLPGLRGGAPWAHGQPYELVNRLTLELRMRLLPYLYGCIALAREYGTPVIRPLWLADPADPTLREIDSAYMVGEHVLIAPITLQGVIDRVVRLPQGVWYDFWTNERFTGGREVVVPAPLERIPIFVRAGATLPIGETIQYTLQSAPDVLTVRVYPGSAETTLYEDHGEGLAYTHGEYRWVYYTAQWETHAIFSLTRRKAGAFAPAYGRTRVEVVGLGEEPEDVRLDRHGAPLWYYDEGVLELTADDDFGRIEVWMEGSPTTPTRKRNKV